MLRRLWTIGWQTYRSFSLDDCFQLAAAISYYVLFSLLPLLIFTVSVFGLFLRNEDLLNSLVDHIVDYLPLSATDGRDTVENALNGVKNASGPAALIALVTAAWAATAVFASVRKALNRVWGVKEGRPYVRQKLVDLVQVALIGAVLIASLVATGVLRALRSRAPSGVDLLAGDSPIWELPAILLPAALTLLVFVLVYRLAPTTHPPVKRVLPGALVAAFLFEVLKNGFAFYVAYFNNYSLVYGSLAGIFLFLLFMYLAACILLIGAELTRTLDRYHAGEFEAEPVAVRGPRRPMTERAVRAVKGLFVRQ